MTDLSKTILPKSDQLNADDLIAGPMTIKITEVRAGDAEMPIVIRFEGDDGRPYKPCKSMRRVLVHCWGADGKTYVGRSITLFRDPDVKWAGVAVGGIRISHLSDIKLAQTMVLTQSKQSRKPFKVEPLKVAEKPKASKELLAAGQAAAESGVDSYVEWKDSLSDEDKVLIKPHHKDWAEIAKEADKDTQEDEDIQPSL